jgi:hypothetical protein
MPEILVRIYPRLQKFTSRNPSHRMPKIVVNIHPCVQITFKNFGHRMLSNISVIQCPKFRYPPMCTITFKIFSHKMPEILVSIHPCVQTITLKNFSHTMPEILVFIHPCVQMIILKISGHYTPESVATNVNKWLILLFKKELGNFHFALHCLPESLNYTNMNKWNICSMSFKKHQIVNYFNNNRNEA